MHHVVVLVSAVPWSGPPRSLTKTQQLLSKHMIAATTSKTRAHNNHPIKQQQQQLQGKVSVVYGHWKSEEEQRQYGNDLLLKLPMKDGRKITHALVISYLFIIYIFELFFAQ
jgi:hypothetical protein